MRSNLLTTSELDRVLRYPRGRAKRMALRGAIPCIRLPDGEIRFDPDVIADWLRSRSATCEVRHA